MAIHANKTALEGVYHIIPDVFGDERGFFMEMFKKSVFQEIGLEEEVVQENMSYSTPGILRALHFQKPPHAQGKLVRCLKWKLLDVAVDIRKGSPTYGKHVAVELSEENKHMLWIPAGFAHGVEVLEEGYLQYLITGNEYNKEAEGGLLWSDPALGIQWTPGEKQVNERDNSWPTLEELDSPFVYEA